MTDHDVIAVGLGPFNLGLAALLDGVPELDAVVFEQREAFAWHPGLMLGDSEVQVPFLADLVTLADPTSPHSFLNYLHERGRLYRFYFYERLHLLRREFDAYCRWVAERLPSVRFRHQVSAIEPLRDGGWSVLVDGPAGPVRHTARHIVLGVGGVPFVPSCAVPHLGTTVLHSADFLTHREQLQAASSVTVIGSGQSAAEIFCDLLEADTDTRLDWFTRSRGFLPMEYSKLGLEHFTPEYTKFFHGLPAERRDELRAGQDLLYKGISMETSERIYDALYARTVETDELPVQYRSACEVVALSPGSGGPGKRWRLRLRHRDEDAEFDHHADAVVFATGYRDAPLPIAHAETLVALDEHGRPGIDLEYRVQLRDGTPSTLFVQNAELHTHGVGTPDLGLGAHRNAVIINTILGQERYAVRERNVFQHFGAPPEAHADAGTGRPGQAA
ncbi:MAG: SidA/IucD/PvdA family monooxygenase [Solirubrobacteraceae bacterium]|nr:SidA/IucD/PvdA family monooxygenase [Solirubrobacteraceae bacterium]